MKGSPDEDSAAYLGLVEAASAR